MDRGLDRQQDRSLDSFALHLAAGPRPPPVNWLRVAVRTLNQHVRQRKDSLKRRPEEHPVAAWARLQREREQAAHDQEIQTALNKVYNDA